ncbi:Hpt domain-containing protein [Dasania sp. GY-MA-18]|uniref:Hpt domain-containing protein n=1 Tax=Dasania phycosphaerae TaxID=2950436 RepID=A0A9J6RIC4_9GAMM|nr:MULTISPECIES: Hpt domain-containing protein [Dasania]MCR8921661.1 Hpt domain-containing protein [Dasania sp. GY-MA-18]MCZ0864089.1 Hpt domain-containing protein [Dasania phycosphaerae]MCZ0867817.1 Hpt domain-containing protein [Dasania phycosphaerae]
MVLEHLDMESLETLREVMGAEFTHLVETFITDSDMRVTSIAETVNAADADAIRRAAHSLKGSASNMGALSLADLCRRLESMGAESKLEETHDLLEQVRKEYSLVREALQAL